MTRPSETPSASALGTPQALWVRATRLAARITAALRLLRSTGDAWPAALAALVAVGGLAPLASVYLTREVVDRLLLATQAHGDWIVMRSLLLWAGAAAVLLLVQQVLQVAIGWVRTVYTERLQDRIIGRIHEQSTRLDLSFYESSGFFDRLHRAGDEATYRPALLVQSLVDLLQCVVTLGAMSVALTMFGVWFPVALFVSALPVLFVVVRFGLVEQQVKRQTAADERRAWYLEDVMTSTPFAAELRLFDLGARFRDAHWDVRQRLRARRLDLVKRRSLAELGAVALGLVVAGGAGLWMASRAVVGAVSLGQLAASYHAFAQGLATLRSLLASLGALYTNSVFLDDLFTFLDLRPAVAEPATPRRLRPSRAVGIRFKDVTFRYPGADTATLDGFNLEIPAGATVALVGPNAAGKSTLIKLLTRLYDPESGTIEIDGVDIRNYRLSDLRSMMTALFQEPVRYWESVSENVTLSSPSGRPSEEQVRRAVAAAGASDIVDHLPKGTETILGRRYGDGVELSTGEWQRIALARAFVRDASIVLLDEPTSALDPWSESDWFERFRRATSGRTCLLITHRLSTARLANVVHVMQAGRIVRSVKGSAIAPDTFAAIEAMAV
jgi:ATP-binding cassette subfamily B protein